MRRARNLIWQAGDLRVLNGYIISFSYSVSGQLSIRILTWTLVLSSSIIMRIHLPNRAKGAPVF